MRDLSTEPTYYEYLAELPKVGRQLPKVGQVCLIAQFGYCSTTIQNGQVTLDS